MPTEEKRPNILFVFSDQQRWDTVGCYGFGPSVTPHLDRAAAEGVLFEHAFTCQPICGPARSCIQSGKFATETGCFRNNIALPRGEKTIADYCAAAGYEVGYLGKWHLATDRGGDGVEPADFHGKPIPPERRGGWKDYWLASDVLEFTSHGYDGFLFDAAGNKVEFEGYRADCLTDFALAYLRTRDGARPFFLFLSYIEPHHQNDHNRYEGPRGSKEKFKDHPVPEDLRRAEGGDWRENWADYIGCVESLDRNFGRLRAELQRLGLAENTVVFYASDHGSHFRTRNSEYKRSCHESSIRVPLLAVGPGFSGGRTVRELVSLIDLPPTLLTVAGTTPPPYMRGRPLQGLLAEPPGPWPEEVFVQLAESHVGRALRTKQWKYSVRAPDGNGWKEMNAERYVEEFLYDLKSDPHEQNNLVADPAYAEVRRELAARLKQLMAAAGEKEPVLEPAAAS